MYSEQVSIHLKMNEKKLINSLKNLKCNKCGLIYKESWFNRKILKNIFNQIVPAHPKGWDVKSQKFSIKYFKKNLKILSKLLIQKNKHLEINKITRELISIADSIPNSNINEKKYKLKLIKAIENKDITLINFYLLKLKNKFHFPEEFKRFRGFNSSALIKYIKSIIGDIKTYSEVGCPLWGGLDYLNKEKAECSFIKGQPHEFWGLKCKKNNSLCHEKLKNIKKFSKIPTVQKKIDYIGVYLYLDHVIDPIVFIRLILKFSNSVGLILESSENGVPIQHFTGWNKSSIKFLAKKFNKKVDSGFQPIKKTGKDFYLIY